MQDVKMSNRKTPNFAYGNSDKSEEFKIGRKIEVEK